MTRSRAPRLGVVIPCFADTAHAVPLVRQLLQSDNAPPPLVVIGDNGGNPDLAERCADMAVHVVHEPRKGGGYARTAAARHLVEYWRAEGTPLERCWILAMDADSSVPEGFTDAWIDELSRPGPAVRSGPVHYRADPGEPQLSTHILAGLDWLQSYAEWLERFAGVVNTCGTNTAARADICSAANYYIQPTARDGVDEVLVAGCDWDFGLRARLLGAPVGRTVNPVAQTSSRRVAADPTAFLSGTAYESTLHPGSTLRPATSGAALPWKSIVPFARARLTGHYLVKPLLAGLRPDAALEWFVGDELWRELQRLTASMPAPSSTSDTLWLPYRRQLIGRLFDPDVLELSGAVSEQIMSGTASSIPMTGGRSLDPPVLVSNGKDAR